MTQTDNSGTVGGTKNMTFNKLSSSAHECTWSINQSINQSIYFGSDPRTKCKTIRIAQCTALNDNRLRDKRIQFAENTIHNPLGEYIELGQDSVNELSTLLLHMVLENSLNEADSIIVAILPHKPDLRLFQRVKVR